MDWKIGGFLGEIVNPILSGVGAILNNPIKAATDAVHEIGKGVSDVLGGIFGAHTETTVATYTSRCIPDNLLPSAIKSGILAASMNDGNASNFIMQKLTSSMGSRAEKAYKYSKNGYIYGSATKTLFSGVTGEAVVKEVIREHTTGTVDFVYYHFGKVNYYHHVWSHLVTDYGYAPDTNQLLVVSTALGYPMFLKDIVLLVTPATLKAPPKDVITPLGIAATAGVTPLRFASTERSHTPAESTPSVLTNGARVTYTWTAQEKMVVDGIAITGTTIKEDFFIINFSGINSVPVLQGDVFQVCYTHEGKTTYWSYVNGSGESPEIDAVYRHKYDALGSFFPMVHFRHNKQAVHPSNTTAPYKSSKKMLGYFGLSYDDVSESIAKNPQIADIEQAFMTMAVPAVTTNPLEQRYLYDFFNQMHIAKVLQQPETSLLSLTTKVGEATPSTALSLMIRDELIEMSLGCSEIKKRIIVGSIGKIGTYKSTHTSEVITPIVVIDGAGRTVNGDNEGPTTISRHAYSCQLTTDMYEEISIYGLNLTYYIFGGHNTVATGDNSNLLIPIDRAISSVYNTFDKEQLYSRSLHFVINSRTEQEIKWYQTALFRDVMLIVAVCLSVWSMGTSIKGYAVAYATGIMTLAAIAMEIVMNIVVAMLWAIAAKVFVANAGEEAAAIVAVLLLARGTQQAVSGSSSNNAKTMSEAKDFLMAATSINNAVGKSISEKLEELLKEKESFDSLNTAKEKELEDAKKLIERDHIATPIILVGEMPKDYFKRTIHSGNIGVTGVTGLSQYVTTALTLPRVCDTLQG